MKIKKGLKEVKERLSPHHHHDRDQRRRKSGPSESPRGPLAPVLDHLERDKLVPIHLHISHTGSLSSISRKAFLALPIPTQSPHSKSPRWPCQHQIPSSLLRILSLPNTVNKNKALTLSSSTTLRTRFPTQSRSRPPRTPTPPPAAAVAIRCHSRPSQWLFPPLFLNFLCRLKMSQPVEDKPVPAPPPVSDTESESEAPAVYLPQLVMPTMFLPIPNVRISSPLTWWLTRRTSVYY
jgi:hypothetical protein